MKLAIRIILPASIFFMFFLSTTSCKKDSIEVVNEVFDTTGFTRIATRVFASDTKTTTGELIIYGGGGNLIYVFKNFKTEEGTNLKAWLANDINNVVSNGYLDLGNLKGTEGNFYYTATGTTASYSYIVVWEPGTGTKFGHAFTI